MLKHLLVVFFPIVICSEQTWVSRASLENYQDYWMGLMQGLVNELEKREWCNLKLDDITQTIDDNLYNFHVAGTVNYTNGFVVSIQKIDIVDIEQLILPRTIDEESVPFATLRGKINFRDMVIGHDVVANLTSPPDPNFRSTGTFWHRLMPIQLVLTQNLLTKELTGESWIGSVPAGSGVKMQYMPSNNVTEALGRRFRSSTIDSAELWAKSIFLPILLNLANNELGFPDVCFNCNK